MNNSILKLMDVSKSIHNIPILNHINLEVYPGEVCCLLGENGAGKSMLMKVLAGVESIDSGDIWCHGKKVTIDSPKVSHQLGIRMAFQEQHLVSELTVAENIALNHPQHKKRFFADDRVLQKECRAILERFQCRMDPSELVKNLHLSERRMVELAKVFSCDADILILDEPTAPLMEREIEILLEQVRQEKSKGKAILYISHKVGDVAELADRVITIHNGEIVDEYSKDRLSHMQAMVKTMTGDCYLNRYPKTRSTKGEVFLQVKNISNYKGSVRNVSFEICSGEIVGLAGLQGAGKTDLSNLLFGLEPKREGEYYINGRRVPIRTPRQAIQNGLAYISNYAPADIYTTQNSYDNINMLSLNKYCRGPCLDNNELQHAARNAISHFHMKITDPAAPAVYLSMGTQQKVVLSRWFYSDSLLFIMDDPSKGLDIPSKVELYNIIDRMARSGRSFLLISSDTNELLGMCDRVLVMYNGNITSELDPRDSVALQSLYDISMGSLESS